MTGRPVAAIDCGTNSTRLMIADNQGRPLLRLMRITGLGAGMDATRSITPGAINRVVAVLREFRHEIERRQVGRSWMVATSAVRDAINSDEFLTAAADALGVRADVLTGEEEGRLAYSGAISDLGKAWHDAPVIDIGGGSTEVIVRGATSIRVVSMDIGCVRLTERFLRNDPPNAAEIVELNEFIRCAFEQSSTELGLNASTVPGYSRSVIGLAGTVSTLSALRQGLRHYERSRIHHSVLTKQDIMTWCDTLAGESAEARGRHPGMEPGRERVMLGGAFVLREAMSWFGFDRCLVSEADLLDGIVMTLLRDSSDHDPPTLL